MKSFDPGMRIGPYQIVGPLGAGGMGEVYRARDTRLGRDVALKVLPLNVAADAERLARLQREAQVLASLNHPGIAAIYGLEDAGGAPALVLELVEGPTLADRIDRGPVPMEEALSVSRQIAEALEYAHERGVIHRDLKPANVKVDPEGRVKVLDFGLAKAITGDLSAGGSDPSLSPTLTSFGSVAGAILGTAAYMSPEQARGRAVDRRADIWAFGALLWEMLTGRRLFDGETISDTLAAVLRAPVEWSVLPANTPPRIVRLLGRCLERDPKKRLRDIGEARILLESLGEEPDLSEPGGAATAPPIAAPPSPGRWLLSIAPWALLALAAIALFAALASRPRAAAAAHLTRFEIASPDGVSGAVWPRLSPDGQLLAFLGRDSSAKQSIWIRPLDSFTAYPLNGTESAGRPFWSPDGRYLAFFSGKQLMKVPVAGGPAQLICEADGGADGAWGSQGDILFDGGLEGIRGCSAGGGVPSVQRKPDAPKAELNPAWPFFLPDGKHYLYTVEAGEAGGRKTVARVAALGSSDSKVLVPVDSRIEYASGYLIYILQSTLVAHKFDPDRLTVTGDPIPLATGVSSNPAGYFSVSAAGALAYMAAGAAGNSQLVWVDREGRDLSKEGEPALYLDVALSPDGGRLAYELTDGRQADIWIRDLRRGVAMRLTSNPKNDIWPVWSPDGTRIVFSSDRAGGYALIQRSSSGTGTEELLYALEGSNLGAEHLSSDGRWLLFDRFEPAKGGDIYLLPMEGTHQPVPYLKEAASERSPRFSPDGRWVAYTSNETGRSEVYVQPYPASGAKWTISTSGGSVPQWRADGKELFYQGPDEAIYGVPMTLGASLDAGPPKQLFRRHLQTQSGLPRSRWAVTADGQRFLLNVALEEKVSAPFSLVLDWPQGMTPAR